MTDEVTDERIKKVGWTMGIVGVILLGVAFGYLKYKGARADEVEATEPATTPATTTQSLREDKPPEVIEPTGGFWWICETDGSPCEAIKLHKEGDLVFYEYENRGRHFVTRFDPKKGEVPNGEWWYKESPEILHATDFKQVRRDLYVGKTWDDAGNFVTRQIVYR